MFYGHRVNAAFPVDAARWANPDEQHGSTEPQPVPIPGGILPPPLIHVFAPGLLNQGFQGIDVEPSVITNLRGFTAIGLCLDRLRAHLKSITYKEVVQHVKLCETRHRPQAAIPCRERLRGLLKYSERRAS